MSIIYTNTSTYRFVNKNPDGVSEIQVHVETDGSIFISQQCSDNEESFNSSVFFSKDEWEALLNKYNEWRHIGENHE